MILMRLIIGWTNGIRFVWYYFSIFLLLKTLFSPWKRQYWKKTKRGFHPTEILFVAVSNLISRFLGMLIRITTILVGSITIVSSLLFALPISLVFVLLFPDSALFDEKRLFQARSGVWDWQYGYTPTLDPFVAELYSGVLEYPVVGKEDELKTAYRILSQARGKNILIIGEPGSGRRTFLTWLAHHLINYRFLIFDHVSFLKDKKTKPEQTGALAEVFEEARFAGNVVLILTHLQQFLDFTTTIEPYLAAPDIHIVGITSPKSYHDMLLPNKTLMKYFTILTVRPPTREQLTTIVQSRITVAHHTPLPEKAVTTLLDASALLDAMEKKGQPEAAIALLDEFEAWHQQQPTIKQHDTGAELSTFLQERLQLPPGFLSGAEKVKLRHLEQLLHTRIVNQEIAISQIANALRRRRLNLSDTKKPIGSFLFLGPTGVGKTETAKALAAVFFEDEKKLIRFDMQQYQDKSQMPTLIEQLAKAVREHPYSVLLLDELEKAHTQLLNLFLTITDEGYFDDTHQGKVLTNNLIIIATSNAASEFIREQMVQNNPQSNGTFSTNLSSAQNFNSRVIEYVLQKHLFSPEFINRFDAVVVYTPLSNEHLKQITRMKLNKLTKQLEEHHGKQLLVTEELLDQIVAEGTHKEFGGREIDRTIKRLVEDKIAEELLNEEEQTPR
ncbi:ATP-dependent Clp protease ATP-binding subunit [Candidatus Roizmanbacteria bacterium]|nr:ATP-dependent Clp protease ATP-binding subunit [Candidatus Roizmanbacteria bacterium]